MRTYLDHAASTPVRESARDAFLDALAVTGNPSSVHRDGQAARALVEDARERVARVFSCDPIEVIFTSGGTESVNLGVTGFFRSARATDARRDRIVVPEAEHHATLDTVVALESEGAILDWVPVDKVVRLPCPAPADFGPNLLRVFRSQVEGKRYDLAAAGRRRAQATFADAYQADQAEEVVLALDLKPLVQDPKLSLADFVSPLIGNFQKQTMERIRRLESPKS
ncbi:MAG: aminotransferase class V-fold PLP-dependent enzyme [Microbacteriaceae bacterium]|nr:aminotransferase class V-fold PLP-dependent enzyme [Microbacteriaceae bacterium]